MAANIILRKHAAHRKVVIHVVDSDIVADGSGALPSPSGVDEHVESDGDLLLLGHHRPPIGRIWLPSIYVPFFAPLSKLELQSNQLTILPQAIFALPNLRELNICNNQLTRLSDAVGAMRKLRELHIADNLLTELPSTLGLCSQLAVLDCSNNLLTNVPGELRDLSSLRRLWIEGNRLGDALVHGGGSGDGSIHTHLPSLRDLCLQECARHTRQHGWHVYCRHDPGFHPSARHLRRMLSTLFQVTQLSHSNATAVVQEVLASTEADIAWSSFLHGDLDAEDGGLGRLFASHGDEQEAAHILCNINVPEGDSAAAAQAEDDIRFAEQVWNEIRRWIVRRLHRNAATSSSKPSAAVNGTATVDKHPASERDAEVPSVLKLDTKMTAAYGGIPGLPPPTPRSTSNPLSPATSLWSASPSSAFSTPSPPSAYERYCILQVVPPDLLLRILIPLHLHCSYCDSTIHIDGLILRQVVPVCGELIPVMWRVCSVTCRLALLQQLNGSPAHGPSSSTKRDTAARLRDEDPVQSLLRSRSRTM
ncbi:hypothetical protein RI367_000045 [Sorochytrium milnesiophthora]